MLASRLALLRFHYHGYAVMKNALDPAALRPVIDAARVHLRDVQNRIAGKGFDNIEPNLKFVRQTLAADLVAIDPATAHESNKGQLGRTLLWQLIQESEAIRVIDALAPSPSYELARVRIIAPESEQPGALPMHQEKEVCKMPGAFVVWLPLVDGVGTETPGLAFQRGQHGRIKSVALNISDVVIFDGEVFHGTDMSHGAMKPRIGFDVRLFPTPPGETSNLIG